LSGPPPTYAYGDDAVALERARLLGQVFAPTTRALLDRVSTEGVLDVIDLGCGPGATTEQLMARFAAARITGLDASPAYVDAARARCGSAARFEEADVTVLPLPGAPADLMYARLLLAHLRDPVSLVGRWAGQLRGGGRVVLEEVEAIDISDDVLRQYIEVATVPLEARGTRMDAGRLLAQTTVPGDLAVELSAVASLAPPVCDAVHMFCLNLQTLRRDPAVRERYASAALDELAQLLEDRVTDQSTGAIVWNLRQLVLRRR